MTEIRPSRRRAHRQTRALHFLGYARSISDGWVYPSQVATATGMSCSAAILALHALKLQRRAEAQWTDDAHPRVPLPVDRMMPDERRWN